MAESTLTTRIQKQKEEAEKRRKAQLEAGGGTPITPVGMAGNGSTPDQAKMAGSVKPGTSADVETPIVEQEQTAIEQAGAQQTAARDVDQSALLQTKRGEDQFGDEQRDAAQEKAAAFSEKMETFGSLGTRVENLVTGAFSGVTTEGDLKNLAKDVGFDLKPEELTKLAAPGSDPAALAQVLSDFSEAGRTDPAAAFQVLVDNQSLFANPSSGIMDIVDRAYSKDPDVLHETVANLVANDIIDPDQVNFEQLISSGFVNVDPDGTIAELGITTDELKEILGDDWETMTPAQIGEEVEDRREDVLANQEKIEDQLADPDLPPQTRIALLDELKRMGAIGAVQYEQRAVEAQTEAADAGKILVGGEVKDVAELLQDEEIKQDVMNFLSDPESEENAEWARLNPEFADWLGRELESLNITKETLEQNIGDFTGIQKSNESFVESNLSNAGGKVNENIMNLLGFGDQGFEMTNYAAGDDPIYDMLNGLPDGTITGSAVAILNDLPASQLSQLKDLPADKLKGLLTTPGKMEEFGTIAKMKDEWAGARNKTVGDMADVLLGGGAGGRGMTGYSDVTARMADLFAQMQFGGNPEVRKQYALMKSVFDADGNGHIDSADEVRGRIDEIVQNEGDLKDMVKNDLGGKISDFRNMPGDVPSVGGVYDKLRGFIGAGDTSISDDDLDKLYPNVDLATLEQLKDGKLSALGINPAKINSLMQQKANDAVDKVGNMSAWLPNFNAARSAEGSVAADFDRVKGTRAELEKMIQDGHPLQRATARRKLRDIVSKTTESMAIASYDHVLRTSNDLSSRFLTGTPPAKYKDLFVQSGNRWQVKPLKLGHDPKIQDIVHKWATWRNFAKDENDTNEFFRALEGNI